MHFRRAVRIFVLAGAALWAGTPVIASEQAPMTRIAFGSCAFQWEPSEIYGTIVSKDPDLYLSLGDAIYGDYDGEKVVPVTEESLRAQWERLAKVASFRRLRATVPVLAT